MAEMGPRKSIYPERTPDIMLLKILTPIILSEPVMLPFLAIFTPSLNASGAPLNPGECMTPARNPSSTLLNLIPESAIASSAALALYPPTFDFPGKALQYFFSSKSPEISAPILTSESSKDS